MTDQDLSTSDAVASTPSAAAAPGVTEAQVGEIAGHVVIFTDELYAELAGKQPCSICRAPLGVDVQLVGGEPDQELGEWEIVVLHEQDCPAGPAVATRSLSVVKGDR